MNGQINIKYSTKFFGFQMHLFGLFKNSFVSSKNGSRPYFHLPLISQNLKVLSCTVLFHGTHGAYYFQEQRQDFLKNLTKVGKNEREKFESKAISPVLFFLCEPPRLNPDENPFRTHATLKVK